MGSASTGYRAQVSSQGRNSARNASKAVLEALAVNDLARAYRAVLQLSNDLAAVPADALPQLVTRAPQSLPAGWDAFVAAVVEWRLMKAGLNAPRWVLETVGSPFSWAPPVEVLPARAEHVPWSFRRRNVRVEEGELSSI